MAHFQRIVPAVVAAFCLTAGVAISGTLDDVKSKGFVQAGVNGELFGFGKPDEKGVWKGLTWIPPAPSPRLSSVTPKR
jgi:general L-amino acid transport system substrate-binding protein